VTADHYGNFIVTNLFPLGSSVCWHLQTVFPIQTILSPHRRGHGENVRKKKKKGKVAYIKYYSSVNPDFKFFFCFLQLPSHVVNTSSTLYSAPSFRTRCSYLWVCGYFLFFTCHTLFYNRSHLLQSSLGLKEGVESQLPCSLKYGSFEINAFMGTYILLNPFDKLYPLLRYYNYESTQWGPLWENHFIELCNNTRW
jgi:hypothetical protein